MEARLAKVRERKQLKQPVTEDEEKTDDGSKQEEEREGEKRETEVEDGEEVVDPIASMIDSELGRARERAERGGDEERKRLTKKKPYVRPWDKGKGRSFQYITCPVIHLFYHLLQLWTPFVRERKSWKMSDCQSLRLHHPTMRLVPLLNQNR